MSSDPSRFEFFFLFVSPKEKKKKKFRDGRDEGHNLLGAAGKCRPAKRDDGDELQRQSNRRSRFVSLFWLAHKKTVGLGDGGF